MMRRMIIVYFSGLLLLSAQSLTVDPSVYKILDDISTDQLEKYVTKLVNFGTRHTLSDTVSNTRGIGAARRWIKKEFEEISKDCGGCLEVEEQWSLAKGNPKSRIKRDTWIVNIYAVKRGTKYPNRYVIMSGDIDSRISDPLDGKGNSPGANDNASGTVSYTHLTLPTKRIV